MASSPPPGVKPLASKWLDSGVSANSCKAARLSVLVHQLA